MSTVIDNRVLEMRFDNKQFESGVSNTMSTLDKLKQKLNLTGATKGLQEVSKATKNVNFSGMSSGIESVQAKFSALQVAGVTAMANITNSAVNAGKRMVSALTIDPIKSGFQEYETQIGAIQTILANTQKEGTNVEIVNRALDELNQYADKTIYNFSEMTRNIGTFTAAGVKLDTSVSAIKGIANLAAISGSTSQQASTAMYQLSQALAAGKVSLMDWNSVVNAGMGGQVFQDALIRTSELLGTGAKQSIEMFGSFRESLTKGQWLTTDVLTETLNQLSGAYDKADLLAQGFSEEQANDILQLAKTAEEAATKVKTFTQLWDTLKEAAQSGWAQTWRTIIGDFEESKELFTGLSNFFGGIIGKSSDTRNKIVSGAFANNPFTKLAEKIEKVTAATDKLNNATDKVKKTTEDYGNIVNKIIGGEFGNGEARFKALTEAGYDWAHAQNLVNEKLGNGKRYITDYSESQEKLSNTQENVNAIQKITIDDLVKMSDAQLKNLDFTKDEISAFRELEKQSKLTGIPMKELVEDIDQLNGRTLLINSFKNAGKGLVSTFEGIGKAWKDIFWNGASDDDIIAKKTEILYNAIATIHKYSTYLTPDNLPIEQIARSFKGLFAIFDMFTTITGGGLKFAFSTLSSILDAFDTNIFDLTANIGDAIVVFRDFVFENNIIAKSIDNLISRVPEATTAIKNWYDSFKETQSVKTFIESIENIKKVMESFSNGDISINELANELGENLAKALSSIPDIMIQIGKDVIAGFQNGIEEGISGSIIGKIINFCEEFIAAFASAMGCHSPSVKTHEIGVNTMQGFINGIKEMLKPTLSVIKYIGDQIINAFKFIFDYITDGSGNIEWDKMFAGGMLIGGLLLVKDFINTIKGIADGIGGIGDIIENAGRVMKSFSKVLNSFAWDLKAKTIQKMAISIAILSGAIYVLSTIEDTRKLWNAVGVVGALAGIIAVLAGSMELMSKASITYEKGKLNIDGLKSSILQIGTTLLLLGVVVKIVGEMNPDQAKQGFVALTAIMVELIGFMKVAGLVLKDNSSGDIDKLGSLMVKLSVSIGLMVGVCKLVGNLSAEEMIQGGIFATAFGLFVTKITSVAKTSGNNVSKVGGLMIKLSIAIGLMVGVCKLVGNLSAEEMIQGGIFATAFGVFVRKLVSITKIGKKQQIAKLGGLLLSISTSLILMVGVCKLVGTLSVGEMIKGIAFVSVFGVFVKGLINILSIGNETKMAKIGATILAMSVSIGILAGVSSMLGMIDIGNLAKGVTAVGILCGLMSLMVYSLKGAYDVQKSIMMMSVAIGAMALSVVALSLIDTDDLAGATVAMSTLMGMFAFMSKSVSGLKNIKIAPLIGMIAVVGSLAAIMLLLNGVDASSAIGSALGISALMLSMSVVLDIISSISFSARSAMKGIIALTAMIIPLMAFVFVLKSMNGIDSVKENVIALIGLITSMTLVLGGLTVIGHFWAGAAIGLLALTAMAIPMLTFVGILKVMSGVENATSNAKLLMDLMTTMGNLLVKISIVSPLAILGVTAMTGLSLLMGAIGTMAVATGALMDKFPSIQKFLDIGLPVLEQLAGSIGNMIGKFVGGAFNGLSSSLPDIGENIAEFMKELSIASDNASGIKGDSFKGVKELINIMGDIALTTVGTSLSDIFTLGGTSMEKFQNDGVLFFKTMKKISDVSNECSFEEESFNSIIKAAQKLADLQSSLEPMGGVISWFTGRSDLETFGDNIRCFFNSMASALTSLENVSIDNESIISIIEASEQLANIQSSLKPMGGVISWFNGASDLGTFGENLNAYFMSIKTALENVDGFKINSDTLLSIIDASSKLADLQSSLKPMGGVISWFTGASDLETFGINIGLFFKSIEIAFSTLNGITIDSTVLESVITSAKKLADLQFSLTPMGGVISWFTGRSDLETFGDNIAAFGESIRKLRDSIGENGITEATITSMTNFGNAIITLQQALPEEGWFDGKMDLTQFSNHIYNFGMSIKAFSDSVMDINTENIDVAIQSAKKITELIQTLSTLNIEGVETFTGIGTGGLGADGLMYDIGRAISKFCNEISNIDTEKMSSSIDSIFKIKDFINSLSGINTSGIESFKTALNSLADINIQSFINSFSKETPMLSTIGVDMIKSIVSGLNSGASIIPNVASSIISTTVSIFQSQSPLLISGGAAMINGLNIGILSGKSKCIQTMSSLMSSLLNSVRSKSTMFKPAGIYIINGLTQGIVAGKPLCINTITTLLTACITNIKSKNPTFRASGMQLMSFMASGIRSSRGSVTSAASSAVSGAANAIRNHYSSFQSSGAYLGRGLVIGINSMKSAAYNAGYALGQAAVRGEKDGQASHSPSKLTIKAGKWLGEGLIIGMRAISHSVSRAGYDMGSNVTESVSEALNTAGIMFNSNLDVQPTISPVMDLSNIEHGIHSIDSMINTQKNMSILSNLSSVDKAIHDRIQNKNVNNVIKAVDKLRNDLNSLERNSYVVNGITYDDGSNISTAIEALIREAIMERRI